MSTDIEQGRQGTAQGREKTSGFLTTRYRTGTGGTGVLPLLVKR